MATSKRRDPATTFLELMRNVKSVVQPPAYMAAVSVDGVLQHFIMVDDEEEAAKLAVDPASKLMMEAVLGDNARYVAGSFHIIERSADPLLPRSMHQVRGWETWVLNIDEKPDDVRRLPTTKQTQAAQAKVQAEKEAEAQAKKTAANRKAGAKKAAATRKKNGNGNGGGGPRKGNGAPKPAARRKRTTAKKTTRARR